MSIWIEIHCDIRNAPTAKGHCANHYQDNPMGMFTDVEKGYRKLKKQALTSGWIKNRTGWICPYCQGK